MERGTGWLGKDGFPLYISVCQDSVASNRNPLASFNRSGFKTKIYVLTKPTVSAGRADSSIGPLKKLPDKHQMLKETASSPTIRKLR